jgi:hypothetical protein
VLKEAKEEWRLRGENREDQELPKDKVSREHQVSSADRHYTHPTGDSPRSRKNQASTSGLPHLPLSATQMCRRAAIIPPPASPSWRKKRCAVSDSPKWTRMGSGTLIH